MLQWLKELFGVSDCRACIARDYHIASLREILREKEQYVERLEARLSEVEYRNNSKLDYFLGMNRNINPSVATGSGTNQQAQLHSIQRQGSIQSRIRRAENASSDPILAAQRRKEYNERIAVLTSEARPETEIVSDPNQSDRQEKDAV